MTDDTIKFQCYEQTGCNVYHYEPEQPGSIPDPDKLRPVTDQDGPVEAGHRIVVPGLMGDFFLMTVQPDGNARTEGGNMLAILEWHDHHLHCTGLVNLAGIRKMQLESR